MGKNNYISSLIMVFISTILWGLSFVWSKQLLVEFNSITVIFFRVIIASFVLIILGKITGKLQLVKLKDFPYFMLIALVQPFLYFIFELSSIKYNSPTLTALIIAQIPIFITIINFIASRKKIQANILLGIVISLLGVVVVLLCGGDSLVIATPIGILLSVAALCCAICYNFLVQRIVSKYSPMTITTYMNSIALFYFMPFFFIMDFESVKTVVFTWDMIFSFIMLGVFCSAVAFLFYIYGIKYLGITVSSMINNFSPAVTSLGVFIVFGEQLTILQIVGIGITIFGLTVGVLKFNKKPLVD